VYDGPGDTKIHVLTRRCGRILMFIGNYLSSRIDNQSLPGRSFNSQSRQPSAAGTTGLLACWGSSDDSHHYQGQATLTDARFHELDLPKSVDVPTLHHSLLDPLYMSYILFLGRKILTISYFVPFVFFGILHLVSGSGIRRHSLRHRKDCHQAQYIYNKYPDGRVLPDSRDLGRRVMAQLQRSSLRNSCLLVFL
jgi:hypothetical protein